MSKPTGRWVVLITLFVSVPLPARGWNATGHKAAALIAYRDLREETQRSVQGVLRNHPQYGEFLAKNVPANANRDEWVVMQASVWPDWIKGARRDIKARYNRPDQHYVNLPVRNLDGADVAAEAIERNIAGPTRNRGGILAAIPKAAAVLKDTAAAPADGEVQFCWLLHLVGDLHQPLHAAAYYTKDSPDGDMGGNLFFVTRDGSPTRLHSLWDGILGNFEEFPTLDLLARTLTAKEPVTAAARAVADPKAWAEEGRRLAETVAYRDGTGALKGELVGGFDAMPVSPPPLPQGYEAKARSVARRAQ